MTSLLVTRALIVVVTLLVAPHTLLGQTLTGRVLDEYTDTPVPGAVVVLLDEDGDRTLQVESDSLGRYRFRVPRPAAFTLAASRLGYEEGRTPLLDLSFEGTRTLDLMVRPRPVALAGFEVTVSAEERMERTLAMFGVQPAALPTSRIVTTDEIEAVAAALDFGHILSRQNIAGITVVRMQDRVPVAPPRVCVKVGDGWSSGCARVYIDGVAVPMNTRTDRAALLPPDAIEMMVVLQPDEAAAVYGGSGGNGVVLIFTRARGWQ